jgi:hypothetical protein
MPRSFRSANFALLLLAASSLGGGILSHVPGTIAFAHIVWLARALPVLLALAVSIVQTMLRRERGVDILALLAIGISLQLGDFLTAVVIALIVAAAELARIGAVTVHKPLGDARLASPAERARARRG